jgi:hypothetical protein
MPFALLATGYAGQKKSSIISIGLTIHNAPVSLREKLAVPEAEWPRAISELCGYPHIEEAAVLSTCNRMELYVVAVSWHRGVREVRIWASAAALVATAAASDPAARTQFRLMSLPRRRLRIGSAGHQECPWKSSGPTSFCSKTETPRSISWSVLLGTRRRA